VSLAIKTLKPECKVIGVEPDHCRSYEMALKHGQPVKADVSPTLADGLAVPTVSLSAARHSTVLLGMADVLS
jgi:threonine dehydratase